MANSTMLVYFDENGNPVHFGEWVNFYRYDNADSPVIINPIPSSYTSREVQVAVNADGSKAVIPATTAYQANSL